MSTIIDETINITEISETKINEAKAIGSEIFGAMQKINTQTMSPTTSNEAESSRLTDFLSKDLAAKLKHHDLEALEAQGAEFCTLKSEKSGLMTSKFGCAACTTGLYIGIAALIGGAVVLTGGMSIAAVAAASGYSISGLAVVISAMTGVSVGAVSAIIGAGQVTLGVVVIGLCEAMDKC